MTVAASGPLTLAAALRILALGLESFMLEPRRSAPSVS